MEVVITSLDALMHRATNASLDRPDPAALEAFCSVLADSPNGCYIATRVIASRIRSPHPTEALLALEVLDACMKRCDVGFHAEVDKFRFLNEMIKLVSPKYYGNKTAPAVRQKVLTLMHSWTIDYPREIKIRDAYEMLKKQGVVKDIPPPPPPEDVPSTVVKPRNKDVIFEDEEKSRMLQKLLQSKNPDDLQAANRLIKTMVREDERRVEAVSRRLSELQTVHNNAQLLDEMLDQYRPGCSSAEDLDLIKELHGACSRLRPTVFKLAAETQHNENMLNEVLEASDELGLVFDKYTAIVLQGKSLETVQNAVKTKGQPGSILLNGDGNSLLDFAASSNSNESALVTGAIPGSDVSNVEALGDIFSSVDLSKNVDNLSQVHDAPILKPVSLVSTSAEKDAVLHQKQSSSQPASRGLAELDALGEGLIKQSLPPSVKAGVQFNSKSLEKVPMNLLGKNLSPVETILDELKISNESHNRAQDNQENMLDLDFLISKTLKSEGKGAIQNSSNDDVMVDISTDDVLLETKTNKEIHDESDMSLMEYLQDLKSGDEQDILSIPSHSKQPENQSTQTAVKPQSIQVTPEASDVSIANVDSVKSPTKGVEVKPLTDINISLNSIKPGGVPPMTVFEEESGLTVVLHFAENKPRPDVSVIVVSTTSRNSQPIDEFKFHAVVPKGCKARTLSPSGVSFPAFSPFLPPAAVTQVLLIARPPSVTPAKVFLKFFITYTCQDDSISEMGEVDSLPLDNI